MHLLLCVPTLFTYLIACFGILFVFLFTKLKLHFPISLDLRSAVQINFRLQSQRFLEPKQDPFITPTPKAISGAFVFFDPLLSGVSEFLFLIITAIEHIGTIQK